MRYPIAAYQIAAAIIQKYIRGILIRFRSANFPPTQWQIRCVHYLSKRGPYGSLVQRQRRVFMYKLIAAIEIQTMWRTYQWYSRLGVNAERHALIIQKYWRCIICRRHYSIILGLMVDRKKLESLARKSLPGDVILRIRGTSCPPSLLFKTAVDKGTHWCEFDKEKLAEFIRIELRLKKANKKSIVKRRSTKKNAKQLKLEQIRKKSQLKWKWFYDNKPEDRYESGSLSAFDTSMNEVHNSEDDVMNWLTNLELDD